MEITDRLRQRLAVVASNGNVLARDILDRFDPEVSSLVFSEKNRLSGGTWNLGVWDLDPEKCTRFKDDGCIRVSWPHGMTSECQLRVFAQDITEGITYEFDTRSEFEDLFYYNKHLGYEVLSDYDSIYAAFNRDNFDEVPETGSTFWGAPYEQKKYAECYAHFLTECAKNTRLIVAYTDDDKVAARAIIWDNVRFSSGKNTWKLSFLDQIYGACEGARSVLRRAAITAGVELHHSGLKNWVSYKPGKTLPEDFLAVIAESCKNLRVTADIEIPKGYSYGIPYQTHFGHVALSPFGKYCLTEEDAEDPYSIEIIDRHHLDRHPNMCPRCGLKRKMGRPRCGLKRKMGQSICPYCGHSIPVKKTDFGVVYGGKMVETEEFGSVPDCMLDKNGELYRGARMQYELRPMMNYEIRIERPE